MIPHAITAVINNVAIIICRHNFQFIVKRISICKILTPK